MDKLAGKVTNTVANLTVYDIKAGIRKVQNVVMNYTEMEALVREATNNDPWGSSSTLMQQIANGTFDKTQSSEVMAMVYRRFTEKSVQEWRQIYKALQLLEFLVKHGHERVVNDARAHIRLLEMMGKFHYIDENGKDQGINVRNRAEELVKLLSDVDRIRAERNKARENKGKYTGVGNSMGSGRFEGFGSDSIGYSGGSSSGYGGYSGGVYGDGGGFGGQSDNNEAYAANSNIGYSAGSSRPERFEEYDEFDEGEQRTPGSSTRARTSARTGVKRTSGGSTPSKRTTTTASAPAPQKAKAPEVDLVSFDDLAQSAPASAAATNDDDDFDDFQSAPAATPSDLAGLSSLSISTPPLSTANAAGAAFAAPQPVSAPKQISLSGMVGVSSISPPPAATGLAANYAAFNANSAALNANYSAFQSNASAFAPPATTPQQAPQPAALSSFQPMQPNYYQSVQTQPTGGSTSAFSQTTSVFGQTPSASSSTSTSRAGMAALRPALPTTASSGSKPAAASGGDAFGSLWSQASTGIKKNTVGTTSRGPSMGQLAQEKSHAAIWGATPASTGAPKPAAGGSSNGLDNLLG